MTCIVGVVHKTGVYLGGDSAGVGDVEDASLSITAHPKVFVNGKFIMGFTSSFRMGQLLQYVFKPPSKRSGMNDMEYMVSVFIPSLRKCFEKSGFGRIEEGRDNSGGTFLVGFNGKLYTIYEDFQVMEKLSSFVACGCGDDLALGAMHATEGMEPTKRLMIALEAAAKFSAGVAPPFHIVKQALPLSKK